MMEVWQISSLPPVECYLPADLSPWLSFSHVSTRIRGTVSAEDHRVVGDTVWGGVQTGREVALGWDWLEVHPGVVCLLDPNSITTNIRFLDERDCYQEPLRAIISANRLAHLWPWQYAVLRHMADAAKSAANQASGLGRPPMPGTQARSNLAQGPELPRAA